MFDETSPPLMTGSTVVVPSISVVMLVTPGGLVTAPGTRLVDDEDDEVVMPVPRGTEDVEDDDEELLLDELDEEEDVDVVDPVPRGMLIEDDDELLVEVELTIVVLLVYGPLPVDGSVPVPTDAWPAAPRAKEKSNERAMKEVLAMSTIDFRQRKNRKARKWIGKRRLGWTYSSNTSPRLCLIPHSSNP